MALIHNEQRTGNDPGSPRALSLAQSRWQSLSATVAELTIRGLAALDEPVVVAIDPLSGLTFAHCHLTDVLHVARDQQCTTASRRPAAAMSALTSPGSLVAMRSPFAAIATTVASAA